MGTKTSPIKQTSGKVKGDPVFCVRETNKASRKLAKEDGGRGATAVLKRRRPEKDPSTNKTEQKSYNRETATSFYISPAAAEGKKKG